MKSSNYSNAVFAGNEAPLFWRSLVVLISPLRARPDKLSTIPYIPADAMALSVADERSFKAMSVQNGWPSLIVRLPEAAAFKTVTETVGRVNQTWWMLPEREVVPIKVLERIDAHVKMMTPILGTHAH